MTIVQCVVNRFVYFRIKLPKKSFLDRFGTWVWRDVGPAAVEGVGTMVSKTAISMMVKATVTGRPVSMSGRGPS